MKRQMLVLVLLMLAVNTNAQNTDETRQRFSVGFGRMFIRHDFPSHIGNNEVVHDKVHPGIYIDLDFMWNRIGFKTGIQWTSRGFYEKYAQPGSVIGVNHSVGVRITPLMLICKIIRTQPVEIIAGAGIARSRIVDDRIPKTAFQPPYVKPGSSTSHSLAGMAGLDVKWNLYKKDIYLGTHLQYVSESSNSLAWAHLSVKSGLVINVSNILYKDKLKKYPAKGPSPRG